jgi:formylglycine-generating enzyme required for sulfatase activity
MKHMLLILLIFCAVTLKAQCYVDPVMKYAPSHFVWIENGKTTMKETEVTVKEYMYYLSELLKDSTVENFVSAIPESLYPYYDLKGKMSEFNKAKFEVANNFTNHKSKKNPYEKPIVNVSYEQATNYALWCTFFGNKWLDSQKGYAKQIVLFRLPTADEYKKIATDGIKKLAANEWYIKKHYEVEKWMSACTNGHGCSLCNYALTATGTLECDVIMESMYGKNVLYPVAVFFSDGYGLYDLQGNAAEMILNTNEAFGGSYKDNIENCSLTSIQSYSSPQPWLGFRLIGEVVPVDGKDVYFDNNDDLHIKGIR